MSRLELWSVDKHAMPVGFWLKWLEVYLELLAEDHAEKAEYDNRYYNGRNELRIADLYVKTVCQVLQALDAGHRYEDRP